MARVKKERTIIRGRFQVKRRRRRESKTDYKHRTNMLRQGCNKHGAVKSRLVVRRTNKKIIVAIVQAFVTGDRVVATADSSELPRYGVDFGLTNYFAAYATGMLCARRVLAQMDGMDSIYSPNTDVGEYCVTEDKDDCRRAYKVFLDIGLARSSRGARVFAAMKGASDGGLHIPHSESKFYGFTAENGLDSAKLRERIFSKPLVEYMQSLKSTDAERYQRLFSGYIAKGVEPEAIEAKQQQCLEAIIADPSRVVRERTQQTHAPARGKQPRLAPEERKARVAAKIAAARE